MLEKQQQRKEEARAQAHKKLSEVNKEFERKQGRVAKAMTAATQPFIGTVEDNIMCMLLTDGLMLFVRIVILMMSFVVALL